MAATSSVPVSVILRTVWNDAGETLVRLRGQSIIALSIVVVLGIIGSIPPISGKPVFLEAVDLMSMIAILPFEIAVFRLLILDEAAPGYQFAISAVRFQRMLGWTVAFWAISNLPTYLLGAVASTEAATALAGIATVVMIFAAIVVLVRIVILLPAIAVDAPGASIGNVFADTRGHAWFIVKAYLAVLLPVVLSFIVLAVLASLGGSRVFSGSGSAAVAVNAIFVSLGFLVLICLMSVQARLFMRIGDRVKGGPQSPGE